MNEAMFVFNQNAWESMGFVVLNIKVPTSRKLPKATSHFPFKAQKQQSFSTKLKDSYLQISNF